MATYKVKMVRPSGGSSTFASNPDQAWQTTEA